MHELLYEKMKGITGSVEVFTGELAWPAACIPEILELAAQNQWMILGGDVLTSEGKYTYDNWCYDPIGNKSLTENVMRSIAICSQYVSGYVAQNGPDYLFVLVISNGYIGI